MRTLSEALRVSAERMKARHYRDHERHVSVLCLDLIGMLDAIAQNEKWGRGVQNRRARQMLPTMRGLLDELWKDTK